MNNLYTSLELSKKIQEVVPSVKTERSWRWYITTEIRKETNTKPHIVDTPTSKHKYLGNAQHTPAYSFTDLLKVIQVLGEKKEWSKNSYNLIEFTGSPYCAGFEGKYEKWTRISIVEYYSLLLTRAYLADNLTISKHTEDFISNLLEQGEPS